MFLRCFPDWNVWASIEGFPWSFGFGPPTGVDPPIVSGLIESRFFTHSPFYLRDNLLDRIASFGSQVEIYLRLNYDEKKVHRVSQIILVILLRISERFTHVGKGNEIYYPYRGLYV